MASLSKTRIQPRTKAPLSCKQPSEIPPWTESPPIADSTTTQKYSVFVSHRVNDGGVTKALTDLLDRHTKTVKFIISENFEKGKAWRQEIANALHQANFLVLVFTDPDEDWGWCLYESGFFDALSQVSRSSGKLIWCLHHASTPPPSPLAGLQGIDASKAEDVEKWLKQLFKHTDQLEGPFRDDIPKLATEICELFSVDQKPIYSERSIKITVNRKSLRSPFDLPGDVTVGGDEGLMAEVFGTIDKKIEWRAIKERFRSFDNSAEVNIATLKEISAAIYCVSNRTVFRPVQGIIFVGEGPKRYRPILSNAKERSKDQIDCYVMLVEESGGKLQNIRKPVEALLTAIRVGVRIRWEIIQPFIPKVRSLARSNPRRLRTNLKTCFNNVILEAGFRGNFSEDDLVDAFDDPDRGRVQKILEEWQDTYQRFWLSIGFPDVNETYGEVSAEPMTDENICLLETALREIESMNRDFLSMAVARAQSLIQKELSVTG
jgi:hypothetical protein